MKKTLVALIMIVAFGASSMAQNAIGLRFGGGSNSGYGAEISFQKDWATANRLEFDLGFSNSSSDWSYLNLSGIYQWKGTIVGILGWYAGVGANLGIYSYHNNGGVGLAIGGQGGLEVVIPDTPIQITLDTRPMFNLIRYDYVGGLNWGTCLSLRYKF